MTKIQRKFNRKMDSFFQQVVLEQLGANVQRNDARHTPYTFHNKGLKIDHGYKSLT